MEVKFEDLQKQIAEMAEKLDAARAMLIALEEKRRQQTPEGEVFSIAETAKILKVSTKSVYGLINRGFLKSNKALRHHRITRDAINEFLKTA